ncbi:MAG TPA: B12-binding domain-containing protein, partial [Aggregatilineaceae bacterium]|nr:B12-binding domain-containing protein [Aggregatilineaceae bacterium]
MIASQALFLQAILKGDRIAADQIVREALHQGTIRDSYLQIFQPSLYEVGRLWEVGQVSIAQEHLATAITQSALASIYARVDLPTSTEQNAIIACLSGNYHEIGPRMLADFMQMAGFNTRFLGADTPEDSLMSMISSIKPDVIGLPATTQEQVQSVQTAIERLRADFASYRPTVMVGGLAFNQVDDLWKKVKADVWGIDAGQAVDH